MLVGRHPSSVMSARPGHAGGIDDVMTPEQCFSKHVLGSFGDRPWDARWGRVERAVVVWTAEVTTPGTGFVRVTGPSGPRSTGRAPGAPAVGADLAEVGFVRGGRLSRVEGRTPWARGVGRNARRPGPSLASFGGSMTGEAGTIRR
jgi:hypothetical protein